LNLATPKNNGIHREEGHQALSGSLEASCPYILLMDPGFKVSAGRQKSRD
jgi:hypothetical protein